MNRYSLALKKRAPKKKSDKLKKIQEELEKITTKDPNLQLREDIKRIIEDHSGGMKLTELVPELMSKKRYHIDIATLMNILHTDEDLSLLEYTWRGNGSTKFFVYTP